MVENQHKKISGYRDLSQDEIDLMNKIKSVGTQIECLIQKLNSNTEIDHWWLNIGTTQCQLGIMSLVRAVAKPTTF